MIDKDFTNIEDEVLLKLEIERLPERDKKIIQMAFDGYSCEEIGIEVDLSERWVSEIIRKFKEKWVNDT